MKMNINKSLSMIILNFKNFRFLKLNSSFHKLHIKSFYSANEEVEKDCNNEILNKKAILLEKKILELESDYLSNKMQTNYLWGVDRFMDLEKFRNLSYEIIEDCITYNMKINERRVVPNVKINFLKEMFNFELNDENKTFRNIKESLFTHIIPNMTLWNHPRFLNWYPSITSFPAILGNYFSNLIENPGKKYEYTATGNDLEKKIILLMTKAFNMPDNLRPDINPEASGYINFAAGEINVLSALCGRTYKMNKLKKSDFSKLKFYYSSHAHYSVPKGVNITGGLKSVIPVRFNADKNNYEMDLEKLQIQIEKDIEDGLIPCYICGTVGTTSTSGVDNIEELGKIKEKYDMWLHVDSAYSGNVFILDEYKYLLKGYEKVNSLCINGNKWSPVAENSGYFFFSHKFIMEETLMNKFKENEDSIKENLINYELFSSRANKSIRLYASLNSFGLDKYKEIPRRFIRVAKIFEKNLKQTGKFLIVGQTEFALVCFTLDTKENTQKYMDFVNKENYLYIGPYLLPNVPDNKNYILRISINYLYVTDIQAQKDSEYLIDAYYRCFEKNEIKNKL